MTLDLVELARSGDRDAFESLVAPHRAELQVHCYRMVGSLQDAEDLLQDTLLAAWLALAGFEGRSSVRTWLYRIATNRCLNHLRATKRRSTALPPASLPTPSGQGEVPWLQPYPDALIDTLPDDRPGPEARYESREAISLAFVRVLQGLPPQQRAVLVLRDVLGYPGAEAADLLGTTTGAVAGALKRARARMDELGAAPEATPEPGAESELVDRFAAALLAFDVDALVGLMTDDVWLRMPPAASEYHGQDAVHRFLSSVAQGRGATARLVPTRANGHPAWAEYRADPTTGLLHLTGLEVAALSRGRIGELTRFEATVAPWFALPRTLDP